MQQMWFLSMIKLIHKEPIEEINKYSQFIDIIYASYICLSIDIPDIVEILLRFVL